MVRRSLLLLSMIAVMVLALLPTQQTTQPAAAQTSGPWEPYRYFPETGHNISFDIKRFYEANGGLEAFVLPPTELITENGQQVQYFERPRFAIPPQNKGTAYYILPTRLVFHFTKRRDAV